MALVCYICRSSIEEVLGYWDPEPPNFTNWLGESAPDTVEQRDPGDHKPGEPQRWLRVPYERHVCSRGHITDNSPHMSPGHTCPNCDHNNPYIILQKENATRIKMEEGFNHLTAYAKVMNYQDPIPWYRTKNFCDNYRNPLETAYDDLMKWSRQLETL